MPNVAWIVFSCLFHNLLWFVKDNFHMQGGEPPRKWKMK